MSLNHAHVRLDQSFCDLIFSCCELALVEIKVAPLEVVIASIFRIGWNIVECEAGSSTYRFSRCMQIYWHLIRYNMAHVVCYFISRSAQVKSEPVPSKLVVTLSVYSSSRRKHDMQHNLLNSNLYVGIWQSTELVSIWHVPIANKYKLRKIRFKCWICKLRTSKC